jgi:hypothetical protein
MKKIVASYLIFIGISMIGAWIMFYVTGSIPELETTPVQISMHLLAEFSTALLLVIAGISMLKNKVWSQQIYFLSMGMLLYTLIQSPGYFFEQKEYPLVIMFALFFVIGVIFTIIMVKSYIKQEAANKKSLSS